MDFNNLTDVEILGLQYSILEEMKQKRSNKLSSKFIDTSKKTVKRDSKEYMRFRESVLKRDNVCQCCGATENLEVHHLFSFKQYNSLGIDTKNGITLCKKCHNEYHSQYGIKKNNNPVTLSKWLRDNSRIFQNTFNNNENWSRHVPKLVLGNDLILRTQTGLAKFTIDEFIQVKKDLENGVTAKQCCKTLHVGYRTGKDICKYIKYGKFDYIFEKYYALISKNEIKAFSDPLIEINELLNINEV